MFILHGIDWEKSFGNSVTKTDTNNFTNRGKEHHSGILYIKTQTGTPEFCWWCKATLDVSHTFSLPLRKVFLKNKPPQSEGYFCRRECAKAYAVENHIRNREGYSKAIALLEEEYRAEGGKGSIKKAPHWKFLDIFSGPMSREQFDKETGKIEYEHNPSIKPREQNPTSCYFKEV